MRKWVITMYDMYGYYLADLWRIYDVLGYAETDVDEIPIFVELALEYNLEGV